jgi:hypothetical protein
MEVAEQGAVVRHEAACGIVADNLLTAGLFQHGGEGGADRLARAESQSLEQLSMLSDQLLAGIGSTSLLNGTVMLSGETVRAPSTRAGQ